MASKVSIESAGDHAFDLGHLRREGGEELTELLLREAQVNGNVTWRLRVEKKLSCNAETRPVAVVGWKPWCCYLKIKPGDNNSCHFCSLLMPDGYRGDAVFEALKGVEDRIDRNWRNGSREQVAVTDEALPPDDAGESAEPPDMSGWATDPDRMRLTLLAIYEADKAGPHSSQSRFVELLCDKLGWHGASRYAIGGIFTSLVRRGLIVGVKRGCKAVGYTLSVEGAKVINDLLPQGDAKAPSPALPVADPGELMEALTGFTQDYAGAWERLRAIRAERAEHQAAINRLDAEARELSKVVDNAEVQTLLHRLLKIAGKATS